MQVTCIPCKQVYYNWESGFRVISCKPTKDYGEKLNLTSYGTFSISGNNLMCITLGDELTVELEKDENSKYAASYHVFGSAGFIIEQQRIVVKEEQELAILKQLMTARQAKSVHSSYPNFIQMIMDGREDEIDTKKIKYVGKSYFGSYVKKLSAERDRLRLLPVAATFGITDLNEIAKLSNIFHDKIELGAAFKENPYRVLCKHLGYPFRRADKVILPRRPEFRVSKQRCEFAVYDVLKNNELEGNTRMSASQMARAVNDFAPELICKIVETVNECPEIYYNQLSKQCALQSTYDNEKIIADNILSRLKHPQLTPMDWEKFKSIDGLECTDEQAEILRLACEQSVMMLTGGAGCVDCDTEFFTGKKWKRIADYQDGDSVLEYELDTKSGVIVEPISYIKIPCETLWHMETKYGVDMTLCDEHNIIYWSTKGKQHECTIQDIIDKQNNNGWTGQFATSFNYNGKGIDLTDEQIRIMCAVICDGSFYGKLNSTRCRFHIKKGRKKERLKKLFDEANLEYSESQSAAEGYTDLYIQAPLRAKVFDDMWYQCSQNQLKIICDEIIFWDGSVSLSRSGVERKRFSANVKENADFVQFAFTACGYRASISSRDRTGQKYFTCGKWYTRKSIEYNVIITSRNMVGICHDNRISHKKTMPIQTPTKDGYKYCFTVPSHMLILRRNGNIFITGNCGKTSAAKALVRMLEYNNQSYSILAPTGIAAKRISQVTGRMACTVHKFLASQMPFGDFLILEESSMLGVNLLGSLLYNAPKSTKIIFICDNAQLASISCGNIVQDIIESEIVPTAQLTKVFRYGIGGIATVSTDTRNGNKFKPSEYPDYRFIPAQENVIDQIISAYDDLIVSGYSANDIMVLCPYNKTNVGTYAINAAIQKKYNAHPDTIAKYRKDGYNIMFKVGDKVVNTANNYHMSAVVMNDCGEYEEMDEDGEHYTISVMNGDIGYVREVQTRKDAPWLIVEFDSGFGLFKPEDIKNLLLGYSLSIHRVQGAETKAVIAIVCKEHVTMATRNLLYVALSRAKEKLIEIGDVDVINHALNIQENKERHTFLKDMLLKGGENSEKI